jgi:hypothetical protein
MAGRTLGGPLSVGDAAGATGTFKLASAAKGLAFSAGAGDATSMRDEAAGLSDDLRDMVGPAQRTKHTASACAREAANSNTR